MPNSQPATSHYPLPSELIREICELSASAFPSSIPRLSLVANQIRHWVEPGLYRILKINRCQVKPPIFLRPITEQTPKSRLDSRPPRPVNIPYLQKFGHHVRHALLHDCNIEELTQILPHIPGVQHLAIWAIIGDWKLKPSSLAVCLDYMHEASSLSLKKVSCDFLGIYRGFDSIPFHKPYFKEITHLQLILIEDDYRWSRWKEITCLDKLTHLCLVNPVTTGLDARFLCNCTQLEVLIFFCYADGDPFIWNEDDVGRGQSVGLGTEPSIPVQDDPRIVNMRAPEQDTNSFNDWEVEARGGKSIWDVATRVVQERKNSGWAGGSLELIEFDSESECRRGE